MKYLLSLLVIVTVGCAEKKTEWETIINTNSVQRYAVPHFADSATFGKMQEAFPVIEKLYRDYA